MTYTVYADGGCAPNPGPGGFAFRVEPSEGDVLEGWGFNPDSTNNRMEITAALEGLRRVPIGASVKLICDSEYVLKGCSQWRTGWESRGMKKADGGAVLNGDLWLELWAETDIRNVQYSWVRGHTGNPGNERVDQLVGHARASKATVMPPAVPTKKPAATPAPAAGPAGVPSEAPTGGAANTETMLMSLLSVKFGPQLRPDATPPYKETAAAIVALLKRLNWKAP